jgi:hypothetical protein
VMRCENQQKCRINSIQSKINVQNCLSLQSKLSPVSLVGLGLDPSLGDLLYCTLEVFIDDGIIQVGESNDHGSADVGPRG